MPNGSTNDQQLKLHPRGTDLRRAHLRAGRQELAGHGGYWQKAFLFGPVLVRSVQKSMA
jgi:hypothetical protein